jgi:hypothetical protein
MPFGNDSPNSSARCGSVTTVRRFVSQVLSPARPATLDSPSSAGKYSSNPSCSTACRFASITR